MKFKFKEEDKYIEITQYEGKEEVVNVPEHINQKPVTKIKDWAFFGNKYIKKVVLSPSIKEIGVSAFEKCENLININFPKSLMKIGENSFFDCKKLRKVIIPEGIETILTSSFFNCRSMISVKLPKTLTEIKYMAFAHCVSLIELLIPKRVKRIGRKSFYNCASLEVVSIPEGTIVDAEGFKGCVNMTKIRKRHRRTMKKI